MGGYSRIWDEAAAWAAEKSSVVGTWHFNNWWVRAALARGHAEWLLKERLLNQHPGHSAVIEEWRLVWPGVVGQYDNSCVIYCDLIVGEPVESRDTHPFYSDDEYGTNFNTRSEHMRGLQSHTCGFPFNSFVFGAPVGPSGRYPTSITFLTKSLNRILSTKRLHKMAYSIV